MAKQIRPLTAYKKANPDLYRLIASIAETRSKSKKGRENAWYFYFGFYETETGCKDYEARYDDPFFLVGDQRANIGTVTELGRLLLTGWYFDIEQWTKQISLYVYRSFHKTRSNGEAFNDLEFKEAVKHIRENLGYYYHNENELKLYLLDRFFEDQLIPLLPEPPKKLKRHREIIKTLEQIHKNRLKKDKNWYVNQFEDLDSYCCYLVDVLESYGVPYLSQSEFKAKEEREGKEYIKEIERLEEQYKATLKGVDLPKITA